MINFPQINSLGINSGPNDTRIIFQIIYQEPTQKYIKNTDTHYTIQFSEDITGLIIDNFYNIFNYDIDTIVKNTSFTTNGIWKSEYTINIINVQQNVTSLTDLYIDYTGTTVGNITVDGVIYYYPIKVNTTRPIITSGIIQYDTTAKKWRVILNSGTKITVQPNNIVFYNTNTGEQYSNSAIGGIRLTINSINQNKTQLVYGITSNISVSDYVYFKIDYFNVKSDIGNSGDNVQNTSFFTSTPTTFDMNLAPPEITFDKQFVKAGEQVVVSVDFAEVVNNVSQTSLKYDTAVCRFNSFKLVNANKSWDYTFDIKPTTVSSAIFTLDDSTIVDNYNNKPSIVTASVPIYKAYPPVVIKVSYNYSITDPINIPNIIETVSCSLVVNSMLTINTVISNTCIRPNPNYTITNFTVVDGTDNKSYTFDLNPISQITKNNLRVIVDNNKIHIGDRVGFGVTNSNKFNIVVVNIPTTENITFSDYDRVTNTTTVTFIFNTPVNIPTNTINVTHMGNPNGSLGQLSTTDNGLTWKGVFQFIGNVSYNNYLIVNNYLLVGKNGKVGNLITDANKQYYTSSNFDIYNNFPHSIITVDNPDTNYIELPIAVYGRDPLEFYFEFAHDINQTFTIDDITFPDDIGNLTQLVKNTTTTIPNTKFSTLFTPSIDATFKNCVISLQNSKVSVYDPTTSTQIAGRDISSLNFSIVKSVFDNVTVYIAHNFRDQQTFSSFTSSNYINTDSKERYLIKTPVPIVGFSSKFDNVIISGISITFGSITGTDPNKLASFTISSGVFLFNKIQINISASTVSIPVNPYYYNVLVFYFDENNNDISYSFESVLTVYNLNKKIISAFQYVGSTNGYRQIVTYKLTHLDVLVKHGHDILSLSYSEPTTSNSQILYGNK